MVMVVVDDVAASVNILFSIDIICVSTSTSRLLYNVHQFHLAEIVIIVSIRIRVYIYRLSSISIFSWLSLCDRWLVNRLTVCSSPKLALIQRGFSLFCR